MIANASGALPFSVGTYESKGGFSDHFDDLPL